jgi:hypothetical protein
MRPRQSSSADSSLILFMPGRMTSQSAGAKVCLVERTPYCSSRPAERKCDFRQNREESASRHTPDSRGTERSPNPLARRWSHSAISQPRYRRFTCPSPRTNEVREFAQVFGVGDNTGRRLVPPSESSPVAIGWRVAIPKPVPHIIEYSSTITSSRHFFFTYTASSTLLIDSYSFDCSGSSR